MDVLKKREKKTRTKSAQKKPDKKPEGTVDFMGQGDKSKKATKPGAKRVTKFTAQKDKPVKRQKRDGESAGKGGKGEGEQAAGGKSHSQIRRQKKKVSDLIKTLRLNYNKLLMKKKELKENKQQLVQECRDLIATSEESKTEDKYEQLVFKHDGCRILQAMIKHGSMQQKTTVITYIKQHFLQLMQQKYSYHLAMKAYYYSPTQALKKYFHSQINGQISKLIMHQFASEVIEFVYAQLT